MSQRAIPSHSCYNPANSSRIPTKNPQITSSQPCNSTALKDREKSRNSQCTSKKKVPKFLSQCSRLKNSRCTRSWQLSRGIEKKRFPWGKKNDGKNQSQPFHLMPLEKLKAQEAQGRAQQGKAGFEAAVGELTYTSFHPENLGLGPCLAGPWILSRSSV